MIFKELKGKDCQQKLSSKMKIFSAKQRLGEFIINRLSLKEIQKGVLQAK